MSMAPLVLSGHLKDLGGGFTVRRLLPAVQRKSVGPFLFFDHFGPVTVQPTDEYDVRPHPHIGLATVTYLFSGAILHRDSLGSVQQIEPGAINWMTAGRGIVHSERRPLALASQSYVNHGIQLWSALPLGQEDCPPSFTHTPASAIAQRSVGDATVRVLIGSAFGVTSPVAAMLSTLYLDVQLPPQGVLELPALAQEMAVYPVDAAVRLDRQPLAEHTMAVLPPAASARLQAGATGARLMVIGGAPLDAPRHMWWNFVSRSKDRIVQAAHDWETDQMGQVPGDTERIPLPAHCFKP
ncbi:MAG: pirin family protein [Acidovorax defluvii]